MGRPGRGVCRLCRQSNTRDRVAVPAAVRSGHVSSCVAELEPSRRRSSKTAGRDGLITRCREPPAETVLGFSPAQQWYWSTCRLGAEWNLIYMDELSKRADNHRAHSAFRRRRWLLVLSPWLLRRWRSRFGLAHRRRDRACRLVRPSWGACLESGISGLWPALPIVARLPRETGWAR